MKKQITTKRRTLFLGLAIFCLFGFFVSIISFGPLEAITYALFSVLFFILWIKKPIIVKEDAPVIITTQAPHATTSEVNSINKSSNLNLTTTSYKTEKLHVTGTSHYQKAIESLGSENYDFELSKKELIDQGFEDEKIYLYEFSPTKVELIEEPDNPYDPNAIKVLIDNVLVGYIKKGRCSHVKKLLHSGKIRKIDADIYGGKYKMLYSEYDDEKDKDVYYIEKDKSDYYVTIEISIEE